MIVIKFSHAGSTEQSCAVANRNALFSIIWALDGDKHTNWWYILGEKPSDYGFADNWKKLKVIK